MLQNEVSKEGESFDLCDIHLLLEVLHQCKKKTFKRGC